MKKSLSVFIFSAICMASSSIFAAAPAPIYTFNGPIRNGNNLHIIAMNSAVVPPEVIGDIQQDRTTGNIVLNLSGVPPAVVLQIRAAALQIFARYNNGIFGAPGDRTKLALAAAISTFLVVYGVLQAVQLPLVPTSCLNNFMNYGLLADPCLWNHGLSDALRGGHFGLAAISLMPCGVVNLATPRGLIALYCAIMVFRVLK